MKKKILIPLIIGIAVIIGVVLFLIFKSSNKSYFNIKIVDTKGTVTIDRDGNSIEAYEELKMRDKDYIRVGSDGYTRIDCDRETFSHFEHNTEASFDADKDKKLVINLVKGEMVVEVQDKLLSDESLTIQTQNTTIAIRGTVIAVKTVPSDDGGIKTINYCLEGKADVEINGTTETLEAGEGWLTITDASGDVVESCPTDAGELDFYDIDINSLKGADGSPMKVVRDVAPGSVLVSGDNFPDMIFRLYIIDHIDTDGNGVLSPSELSVDKIDVESSGIKDLTGIEYFTEITYLNCSKNELTSLDLSKNTKLESLYCGKNQLTSLNIVNSTELVYLSCGNNKLTSLDVTNCPKLETIKCGNNELVSLDITRAGNLIEFDCSQNSINHLDLTNNTRLEMLECSLNPLFELDLSNNTSLSYLYCYDDQINELDVSSNTALEFLYCGNNLITSIDVSKNRSLKELSCYNILVTELDVSNNEDLTLLNCGSNNISTLDVSNNPELTNLDFAFTKISEIDLSNNPKLERLNCMYTELTSLDLTNNKQLSSENIDYDIGKNTLIR